MYKLIEYLDEQGRLTDLERETLQALWTGDISPEDVIKYCREYPEAVDESIKALEIYWNNSIFRNEVKEAMVQTVLRGIQLVWRQNNG